MSESEREDVGMQPQDNMVQRTPDDQTSLLEVDSVISSDAEFQNEIMM